MRATIPTFVPKPVDPAFTVARLLREALEGVVAPTLVSPLLFEALEPYGARLPSGPDGLLEMARGPLAAAVARRIGPDEAEELVQRAERLVAHAQSAMRASQPAPPPDRASHAAMTFPKPSSARDRDSTALVPTTPDAVRVLVVAEGAGLALRLDTALGASRVSARSLASLVALRDHLSNHGSPSLLLVDASDFPAITPDELVATVRLGPSTMIRAVWGSDLPYGRSVLAAAGNGLPALLGLDRAHGVDPLLDLIRSRRSS